MPPEGFDAALGASYRLLERVGQGATGEVWRAEDRRTGEAVAAKLLRSEYVADADVVARFVQERSLLTGLRHPNLVRVRDLVVEGDRLAIVMDFLAGGTLRGLLATERTVPPRVALELVAQVLDGLAAAHADRLLHRDVKPDNVLLTADWRELAPGAVRLTDFGIARIVGERSRSTTGMLGTPEYMSPEMITTGVVGAPSDVYGVGVLLYELLSGRTPFAGPGTDYTIAHRHVTSAPAVLPVPSRLWDLLDRMLDKDPRERPSASSAATAARALAGGLAQLPALTPQAQPDDFDPVRGPVTMVRGLHPERSPEQRADGVAPRESPAAGDLEEPDLGMPAGATTVRPVPRPRSAPQRRATHAAEPEVPPWWRQPKALVLVALGVVLVAGGIVVALLPRGGQPHPPVAVTAPPVRATQQDESLPTGLTVSRAATYDPARHQVELTIGYAAQTAPLRGPFLEVIGGGRAGCPSVSWTQGGQETNLPSVTGVTADCGWSIDPGPVPAQQQVQVTATVDVALPGSDPGSALQDWLDREAQATTAALTDPQVSGAAYPVQRLQSIEVVAPASTVSGRTLPLTLYPVWPSGRDPLDPLYRSPSVGAPSSLLQAVAGGEDGVHFGDSCAGAAAVSPDGLVVTALSPNPSCDVTARVGNFPDLHSNSFAIVTRGG